MIGFIGGGNMAEAMIKGMTAQGMKDIYVSEPNAGRRQDLERLYGIRTSPSNKEVVGACQIVILAVKPQIMADVLSDIADSVTEQKTVVSIAAGITLAYLGERLKTKRLIRVMPNTPALVQEGMSVMSLCECFSDEDLNTVRGILMSIGKVMTLPEKMMDAVTAVSGSGPAFYALFVEAMIAAGQQLGLQPGDARELAVQTIIGTSRLLETGMPPDRLRQMVTSPGGTTAAGLDVFEARGLTDVVAAALTAARNRSEELGRR